MVLRGERVTLRPATEEDLDALLAIVTGPGVVEWWGTTDDVAKLREDLLWGFPFVIEVGGEVAGWLDVWEEPEPDHRHAGIDIALAPAFQDRGLGPEALRLAARWAIDARGHHRVTIDPAAANARAIRAYEKVGFRPVGILRRNERGHDGTWHDTLLMDLLAEELTP
jgi:aminoglycoside 6'-N-acetyltransferase